MSIKDRSKPFSFFFALRILPSSLFRDILMITFFGPALDFIQWQVPVLSEWTSTSIILISSELSPRDIYQWKFWNTEYLQAFTPGLLLFHPALMLQNFHFATQFSVHLFCYYNIRLSFFVVLPQFRQIRFDIVDTKQCWVKLGLML